MTITVIGATGKVGTLVARGLLAKGQRVLTLARDPGKARDRLGPDSRLEIIPGDLGTPADLEAAFRGADAAYVALGWIGLEGNLGRLAVLAAGAAPPCRSSSGCPCRTPRPHRGGSASARTGTSISPPLPASPTPRSARRSSPPACSPPAPRSASAGPGPGWRTDCIHVGKNGTLACKRREPAHRPGDHQRKGLDTDLGDLVGVPRNGADHDRSLCPEAVRAPAAACSGHGRGRHAASAGNDRTARPRGHGRVPDEARGRDGSGWSWTTTRPSNPSALSPRLTSSRPWRTERTSTTSGSGP
jgi:NAD(P)H-binding